MFTHGVPEGSNFSNVYSWVTYQKDLTFLMFTYGVKEGSNLGPPLFLIFINNLPNSSTLLKYVLFADDNTLSTCLPRTGININSYTEMLNN